MDNSWDYNEGASEIRMGRALRDGYRERVFLMTKIDGRSKKEAERQLEESLQRLQVADRKHTAVSAQWLARGFAGSLGR